MVGVGVEELLLSVEGRFLCRCCLWRGKSAGVRVAVDVVVTAVCGVVAAVVGVVGVVVTLQLGEHKISQVSNSRMNSNGCESELQLRDYKRCQASLQMSHCFNELSNAL